MRSSSVVFAEIEHIHCGRPWVGQIQSWVWRDFSWSEFFIFRSLPVNYSVYGTKTEKPKNTL